MHKRENLPFVIAGKGGGSIKTGRFLPDTKGNQGDLLTTLLACAGIPIDRPVGIATKQLGEIKARQESTTALTGSRTEGACSLSELHGERKSS